MINVFVYGSLKKGYGNSRLLANSVFVGEDETVSEDFDLRCWGGFPAVYKGGHTSIKGELYLVDDSTLKSLDYLEGYPSFYDRERFRLRSGTCAWMYFIDSGEREGTVCLDGTWSPDRKRMYTYEV